ncbi:MAG: HlyD family type I secretion periplasmic adaptor subunit [Alphaproteobacteria bacterium]
MAEWTQDDLYSDDSSQIARTPPTAGIAIMIVGIIVITVASLWMHFAQLDIVTHGSGQVVPTYGVPELQNNEGGIVDEIFIREGDTVQKGDPIIQLINPTIISNLDQAQARKNVLDLQLKSVSAEYQNLDEINYTDEEKNAYPFVVARQEQAFEIRKQLFKNTQEIANAQLQQALADKQILDAKLSGLLEQQESLQKEAAIIFPLVDKGTLPAVQGVNLQQQVSEIQNEIAIEESRIPEVDSAIAEAQQKIRETEQRWVREVAEKISALRGEVDQVNERIIGAQNAVERSLMTADEDGIIKTLNVSSIGDVVKPGETVAELVPLGEKLLIEAQLEPKDRGQITQGALANVKITAYDASIFGSILGEVVAISPDTIQDERNPDRKYFTVTVSTEKDYLVDNRTGKHLQIIPGMAASVDIRTGALSVWDRMLRPFKNILSEAGKES